ncbi:glycosyltransferase family 61 protein [Nostoc linckia]|uniref:glycosyltransferase family 61 protein n=2 Tax=Nostoc linckia TaxID=92942 RepID=UPI000BFFF155|nr:glycosyltransferase family 61 protein [Nostoc linckia]
MKKSWRYLQEFLIFKLIYPVLLKYINEHLITPNDEMEKNKKENNVPNLEPEYQQLPILRLIYSILFNYLHENFISREDLLEQCQEQNNLYQLNYEEAIYLEPAISYQEIPTAFREKEGRFEFTNPFAAVVNNVELFGIHGIGFTQEKKIILEIVLDRVDVLEHTAISTLRQGFNFQYLTPVKNIEHIDLACSLVNYWSPLYAHWIYEALTRLEVLEYYSQNTGKKPKLIIDKNPPIWETRSLELMGYSPEDYIEWNGTRAKINELVICSKRREGGRISIKACHWVRERILSNVDSYANPNLLLSPKIFISRRKANARRILNEEQVIDTLAKMDFVPYVLEDLDFADQVKLFAQAEFIIAPHGGGVTNIIFSQNLTLIELFGQKISHFYYTVAQGLKFDYACMFCEAKNEDIIVNCQELTKMVHKMTKTKIG